MLGGSGSQRRTGLGFTRGESKKQLGVVGRLRANSTNPFGAINPGQLIMNDARGGSDLAPPSSPRSITSSNSSAMDAILEKARMLSARPVERTPSSPVREQTPAIPSCMRRARSVPPPPSTARLSTRTMEPMRQLQPSSELKELKELVTILQKRNEEYEEKINSLQSPFYGIVKNDVVYFFTDIPSNAREWEENKEGEASQNDWVPILHGERVKNDEKWISVLYMYPESGETEVFWTLKSGFAAFSLYPLIDRTVDDFV